jgi:hypothetical protein
MQLTMKKTVVVLLLAAALLLGMLAWTAHAAALPFMQQGNAQSIHTLADGGGSNIYCPPFPRYC